MIEEKVLNLISFHLNQQEEVVTVYLFGSTVKDRERKDSDLDLAVLFKEGLDDYRRLHCKLQLANELEDLLQRQVDIVDLRSADYYFVHQVMKNKIILVDKDISARVDFEVDYRKKYFDHKRFYELYHRQAIKRLKARE